jgi:hypothetical protein
MTEYDIRQYRLMLNTIKEQIHSMSNLKNVLNNLQSLASVLGERDEEWLSLYSAQWWMMEEFYAYYSSEDTKGLDEDALAKIERSRLKLYELIKNKVQDDSPK